MTTEANTLAALTAEIVGAYVANNSVATTDLPTLIDTIHNALRTVDQPDAPPEVAKPTAASIRKSITPDALISFIDGKPYRMLKRHVGKHGMSLADYKVKFGLPRDYPTTSPSYSAARSALAKSMGLGQKQVAPPVAKTKTVVKKAAKTVAAAPATARTARVKNAVSKGT